jgi:peptidoglycan pentaglycine glycine transferase (the first glycine)
LDSHRVITPAPDTWDAFVAGHAQAHLLQLPAWGDFKSRYGWRQTRVALADETGTIQAGAQILLRPLPLKLGTLAYIPKGPLAPADWWTDPAAMTPLWQAIHTTARKANARWLKVEAPTTDNPSVVQALQTADFRPALQTVQPPRTIEIDLSADEDAILKRMKQKTRYNIRLSGRKEVVIRQGTAADIVSFASMMDITGERDAFGVHSADYYTDAYRAFAPADRAALFIASYNGQDLAGVMVFAVGQTAWYFYGASTNEERQRMPTYAVQWAAIQWAKARGCMIYDMWGVPDEEEAALEEHFTERHDGLWSVYRFKRGFGGELVRQMPAWDYVYNAPLYAVYRRLIMARRG